MRDARGKVHDFSQTPRRVVSLVPSLTETLFDLGAGNQVAGITDFCIFPEALDRPRVGGTKNPDIEKIRALAPDLVHMNLEENLRRHAEAIETFAPVFVTEPKSVSDVAVMIRDLGEIHDARTRAAKLTSALEEELRQQRAADFTFVCAIWKQPWMWCGGDTYVSNLVEAAGGRNLLHERRRYPAIDVHAVALLEPDVVFLPDEPYLFTTDDARNVKEMVRGRVIGPFPGHLFTWHGSRTIQGLRFLRETCPGEEKRQQE